MTFVVWFISSLPYLPQILSNLRVKLSSKGIHVQIFAIFWKLKCLMFVSSIISESSNVRTMYLFAYIRMFGCSTFVCSQDPDCLDVLMFVHEQMFNIRGWRWNLTKSIWKMRLSHGLICIRFRNLTNSNQCQIINFSSKNQSRASNQNDTRDDFSSFSEFDKIRAKIAPNVSNSDNGEQLKFVKSSKRSTWLIFRREINDLTLVRICRIPKTNAYQATWQSHLSNGFCQIPSTAPYNI